MKFLAVSAVLVAVAAADSQSPASIPSQTLNSFQASALATLSAAQAALNSMNSQMIAQDKASQEAAIHSQSVAVHENISDDLGSLDSSESESAELGSLEGEESFHSSSGSSVAGSMLALALVAGAAMF
ncbi:hypothetical protein GGI25_000955 [Coemansia spiralis]|uniref:Uncharacterized protein n=2 Tax=Coemansia TaxID=4863 RepID=A0A9W8GBQ1_9FUNG|nr:hypothetical protein BX070DRAFT_232707 [Coemansia spiralis]KAJ1993813.1 hypothetical protein EDC05_001973 [Coemansia umbellata]KAJ2623190.1 hypothetical protein GGI26_002604 [Coemansia sp. RSA 1358]KAJ2680067.1 hypothetical protein GGI25_000955 [Coemansia spiralis]